MIDREKVFETIKEIPVKTRIKAWVVQINKKFYHVAEFGGMAQVNPQTGIWESNKNGKRTNPVDIFRTEKKDYIKCINAFIDKLEKDNQIE